MLKTLMDLQGFCERILKDPPKDFKNDFRNIANAGIFCVIRGHYKIQEFRRALKDSGRILKDKTPGGFKTLKR